MIIKLVIKLILKYLKIESSIKHSKLLWENKSTAKIGYLLPKTNIKWIGEAKKARLILVSLKLI